ncbi:O-succinylbenzoic acid--CoA ligase [Ectothiorhodospira magna]|uniref:O-succinylbenzoic acid--CoA ligase n=1 Tax=Ectothiorhodospira magna TaxID=867345 RepID=A0A1H9FFH8_9GAMM|nr:o-succinylbenzoate--CoA ligase [Ectothiorhodospira magna]SEQ36068.1 O-succinylbenzoic acid--CoA ligase [Ectothiorhodospira magna]
MSHISSHPDLPCLLHQASGQHPQAPAILTPGMRVTFAELETQVSRRADILRLAGIRPGDWVALRTRSSLPGIIDLLAIMRSGACLLPVNPALPMGTLTHILEHQGIGWLLQEPGQHPCPTGQPRVHTDPDRADHGTCLQFPAHAPCSGIFTSGSTGQPRIAVHRYPNHVYSAAGSATQIPLVPGHRYLLSLPTYHIGGLAIVFRCLMGGAALVLDGRAEDAGFLLHMAVTHVSMVETQLYRLLQQSAPLPRLECLLLGGGPVRETLLATAAEHGLPCWTSYGLTEMTAQVITQPPQAAARILPHRECHLNHDQEILVRGDTLFMGYRQGGHLVPATDADGWFHTRDLGRWDRGQFTVTGRLDNQFISGGENIQPEIIEQHLHDHPDIVQAVVVPRQDPEFGQRPVAFIQSTGPLNTKALQGWLRERLNPFMVPVAFLPLPPSADLKARRRDLIRLANAQHQRTL